MFKLGISIDVTDMTGLQTQTEAAAVSGFQYCQLFYRGADLDKKMAEQIAGVCYAKGITIGPVGGYINALKPAESPMGYDLTRLLRLIDLLPILGSKQLIIWSGTLSDEHMFQMDERNTSNAAFSQLKKTIEKILSNLEAVQGTLVIEPFFTHILRDEDSILAFLADFQSSRIQVVMDPPNFMTPDRFTKQDKTLDALFHKLKPYIGVVHFKDIEPQHNGSWPFDYPGPGQGKLNYNRFVSNLKQQQFDGWGIIEHVQPHEYIAAKSFIEKFFND